MKRNLLFLALLSSLVLSLGACREPVGGSTPGDDTIEPGDGIHFGDAGDGGGGDLISEDTPWVPEGYARITFFVDDRASETFQDGDIKWTGSFAWSAADNSIEFATSWLPTDGPFPLLYDDGPVTDGGHEMGEAVAGDHIFSTEVYFKAEAATTFQYGVLNELDFWMWEGPNGEFTIPTGSTGSFHAEGLVLQPFGAIDLKVTVDTNDLHPDFAYIQDWAGINVYLKGNMNMWTPVQVVDSGPDGGKGDDVAGDGIYTYVQSLNLGKHTGLLLLDQHAQFTAMFSAEEDSWVEAAEYKILLEGKQKGAKNGVHAFTRCGDGDWSPAEVAWEVDSWGTTENTTVVAACDFVPECEIDDDCDPGELCEGGLCEPGCDEDGDCPEGLLCFGNQCKAGCHTDGDCAEGETCEAEHCVSDVPVSEPGIASASPDSGPVEGGSLVTVTGTDFQDGAVVGFGGIPATAVDVKSPTQLTCVTPTHGAGKVDVVLTNPDGGATTFLKGFTYIDEAEAPVISWIEPGSGPVTGGTVVALYGQNFQPNPTVFFGTKQATALDFKDSTTVWATSPSGALGTVDLRLVNLDAQEDTLAQAFTYVPNVPDYAKLLAPLSATAFTSGTVPTLYAEVYEPGMTEGMGGAPGMQAELVYGPVGSDPSVSLAGWTTLAAVYDSDNGNNDLWVVEGLTSDVPGIHAFTFRFSLDGAAWIWADSDGSQNGFDGDMLGTLEIIDPGDDLVILTAAPGFGAVTGGAAVTVTGANFTDDMTVEVGGVAAAFVFTDAGSVVVTMPANLPGPADIVFTLPGGESDTLEGGFEYVLLGTPAVDGDLGDWEPAYKVATNSVASNWDPDLNALSDLYLAYDATNLYIAVSGYAESPNYILGTVDVDFGAATGVTDMGTLTDNGGDGDLDDALSNVVTVTAAGFGAEFGFGAQGNAVVSAGDLAPNAGWRALDPPGNFSWIPGPVDQGAGAVETSVALADLLGGAGIPSTGLQIAVAVKLSNKYGGTDGMSNQCLPECSAPTVIDQVAVITLR
ncbi:MAG: IPT/TIG domain-containing protein [Pseudomonadota bacterium]